MRHVLAIVALSLAACGGGPALQNVPQPATSTAAGLGAAAAAAATLADPNINRTPEKKTPVKSNRPVASGGTVPDDVFDRLDDGQAPPPTEEDPELTAAELESAPPLPPPVLPQP